MKLEFHMDEIIIRDLKIPTIIGTFEWERKEKQEIIKAIIQSSAVATFVIDSNYKVIYWNKSCEQLTGSAGP